MKTKPFLKYLASIVITAGITAGIIYAIDVDNITKTDYATGDKITATWVNAVNNKLNTVGATNGTYASCYVWYGEHDLTANAAPNGGSCNGGIITSVSYAGNGTRDVAGTTHQLQGYYYTCCKN